MLRFHADALKLAGVEPRLAQDAASVLAAVETRIGRELPDSVREWYALDGACELLNRFSNADPAFAVWELGSGSSIAEGFLDFRHENQSVCKWAIWLNGADDPPVCVNYGDSSQTYLSCAKTFSDYVYACVWDWGHVLVSNSPVIQAQNVPISGDALAFLRRHFITGPETTGWPGDVQYRFHSDDQRILIWAAKDQADWWLVGDDQDAAGRLVKSLWNVDNLSRSLWSNDIEGEALLQRLRGQDRRRLVHV